MDYGRLTEEELALRFRDGDAVAFEMFVERFSRAIYNFALRLIGNPADAEDVTQQTFIQAFESLPHRPAGTPVRPWLFQVARNKCIDMIRRRHSGIVSRLEEDEERSQLEPADERPLPEALYERAELQQLLEDAIAALPLRAREVVTLRYVAELTFGEIGEALGMPENTARIVFHRAKSQLRAFLQLRL
jgi:RNA polymerase sigma-70 factor (ECF subfamily)